MLYNYMINSVTDDRREFMRGMLESYRNIPDEFLDGG